jgi:hypothetical protein
VQAGSREADVRDGASASSPMDEEQAAKKSPLTTHDKMMDRRATSLG